MGYVLQMNIYHGNTFEPAFSAGVLKGTNVVKKLLQGANLLNKWYHVFTDNIFSSLNLARSPLTLLVGSDRKNVIRRRPMTHYSGCFKT